MRELHENHPYLEKMISHARAWPPGKVLKATMVHSEASEGMIEKQDAPHPLRAHTGAVSVA
jgi:hypothetical protein